MEQGRVQPGYELPAVVYRCIEYLNSHKAKLEEGIYLVERIVGGDLEFEGESLTKKGGRAALGQ